MDLTSAWDCGQLGASSSLGPLCASELGGELEHALRLGLVLDLLRRVVREQRLVPAAAAAGPDDHLLLRVVDADGFGPAVPGPVLAALLAALVPHALREPLAGLGLRDVPAGDVLHEDGEELAEPEPLFAEQLRLRDAPGVHGRERDPRRLVVPLVQLQDGLHVAELRVLVRLRAVEHLAVDHRHRSLARQHLLHPLELAQRGLGPDQTAPDRVGVAGDRPDHDHAGVRALLHVVDEERAEQEVREVVDLQRLLDAVHGVAGLGSGRLVGGSVADEGVEGEV
mmetsp:Transcript_117932/g.176184  ORF Transcript_117932/g.176184 Transcript_117932/m.176184 type:complete len:282 (+) Transcript_117932:194-1039(+)